MIIATIKLDMVPHPFKTWGEQLSDLDDRMGKKLRTLKLPNEKWVQFKSFDKKGYAVYDIYGAGGRDGKYERRD